MVEVPFEITVLEMGDSGEVPLLSKQSQRGYLLIALVSRFEDVLGPTLPQMVRQPSYIG